MTTLPTDRRHERALARLTDKLKQPRVQAFLKSWLSALDDIEEELDGLAVGMTSIDDAEGVQLQRLAKLVGAQTVGNEVLQRILIKTRIKVVRSSGTGDDLLGILRLITDTATLVEYFPASVVVGTLYEIDETIALYVYNFMNRARSAGVRLAFLWSSVTLTETFVCAPAQTEGDVLDILETATGLTATICVGPDGTELVSGALTLAAVGSGALSDEDALAPDSTTALTWPRDVLRIPAGLHGFLSSSATACNFSQATSTLVAVGYYSTGGVFSGERLIASKRDDAGGNAGWDIYLSNGKLSGRIDSAAGAVSGVTHSTTRASTEGWHVALLLLDQSLAGFFGLYDETEEAQFGVFTDNPATTDPLALGTSRGISAPEIYVKFVFFAQGAQVEGLVIGGTAALGFHGALAGEPAPIDAARGTADVAQTTGGHLLGVL